MEDNISTRIQSITSKTVCFGFVILAPALSSAASAADNPLVGQWKPAAQQPNQNVARNVEQLDQMEITPTHLAVFGESPVTYSYEQNGQQHAVCLLIGNPQDSQTGRSDCRRIN